MIGHAVNFKSSGGSDFIINDRFNQPLLWQQAPFYYISLKTPDGMYGAEISFESHPIPQFIGEKSGDVFRRGKSITLSGNIEAMSMGYLEAGADFLGNMFAETAKRKLIWTRYDGVTVYFECRVNNDLAIGEEITGADKYVWTWLVGLRADDPRSRRLDNGSVYPTWQQ